MTQLHCARADCTRSSTPEDQSGWIVDQVNQHICPDCQEVLARQKEAALKSAESYRRSKHPLLRRTTSKVPR